MNLTSRFLELRKALQFWLETLDPDTQGDKMIAIASVFPVYEIGKAYKAKTDDRPADVFSYGTNAVGDPQLYMVLSDHTSAAEWIPGEATSLYKAIGITEDGIPVWVQPLGASDAYDKGDPVYFEGVIYESTIDGNVWSPAAYPDGWKARN